MPFTVATLNPSAVLIAASPELVESSPWRTVKDLQRFAHRHRLARLFPQRSRDCPVTPDGGSGPKLPRPRARVRRRRCIGRRAATTWMFANALIDGGADLRMPGGSIGTPLDNAISYALLECRTPTRVTPRGQGRQALARSCARIVDPLERARLRRSLRAKRLSKAFWHACGGGQRRAAEYLLLRGADLNWVPDYADGTPLPDRGERTRGLVRKMSSLGSAKKVPARRKSG